MGSSLYISPPSENPRVGNNFTLQIKTDSLEQPINAIKGVLSYNKERVEIINVSKIGSIFNLWVEEPQFSNVEGKLRFQGGVPKPGFIGNGGTVLLVILRAKTAGPTSLIWEKGEVLAADGKGTNILSNLQNLSFVVEADVVSKTEGGGAYWLFIANSAFLAIFLAIGLFFAAKAILKYHDKRFHHGHK